VLVARLKAMGLYDELLRVPLLVKLPPSAHAGVVVAREVGGIDIAPTVLAALSVPVPAVFEGTNLLPEIGGPPVAAPPVVSQRDGRRTRPAPPRARARHLLSV
jgi:arylsulfatase A-like enzyme